MRTWKTKERPAFLPLLTIAIITNTDIATSLSGKDGDFSLAYKAKYQKELDALDAIAAEADYDKWVCDEFNKAFPEYPTTVEQIRKIGLNSVISARETEQFISSADVSKFRNRIDWLARYNTDSITSHSIYVAWNSWFTEQMRNVLPSRDREIDVKLVLKEAPTPDQIVKERAAETFSYTDFAKGTGGIPDEIIAAYDEWESRREVEEAGNRVTSSYFNDWLQTYSEEQKKADTEAKTS